MNTPARPEDTAVVPMVVVPAELLRKCQGVASIAYDGLWRILDLSRASDSNERRKLEVATVLDELSDWLGTV